MDTYTRVKKSINEFLLDPDRKVIALTGEWGVGKTHLWKELLNDSQEASLKSSIYISIFGAKNIDEVKIRILQNAHVFENESLQASIQTGASLFQRTLEKFTGLSAKDAALLWLPKLTNEKLIVIDDLERRGPDLKIQEIMGFLNEYSETHKTRFLVLLNTKKLKHEDEDWKQLHEKVIDVQIHLGPESKECFEKALLLSSCKNEEQVLKSVSILNIKNIRVIKKIIKNVHLIETKFTINDTQAERWIPSTVLLTALAFEAIENAPSFEYVCTYNPYSRLLNQFKDTESVEYRWNSLLDSLGINHTDDFEILFQDFLKTGLLNEDKFTKLFAQYEDDLNHQDAHNKRNEFLKSVLWDSKKSKDQLLKEARELLSTVNVMDPPTITNMVEVIDELGDTELAEEFLTRWEDSLVNRPAYQNIEERIFDNSFGKIHKRVLEVMCQLRDEQHPPLDLYEAADRVIKNSGWGDRERIAFKDSTKEKYIEKIQTLNKECLYRFFKIHFEWFRNSSYDLEFENGKLNFLEACRALVKSDPRSRMSEIILRQFEANGQKDLLK